MKINISDEVLVEIGKSTVLFSYIESSLSEIIARIVTVGGRVHELGVIMTAELSFQQRIGTLDSLLLLALGKDSPVVADFNRIKPLLQQASQARNRVVHSVWAKDSASASAHDVVRIKSTAKQKKGLRMDFEAASLNDLREIADSIGNAYGELCIFETGFHPGGESDEASGEMGD